MKDESEINDSQGPFEPVAIIGMSCIFPDSEYIDHFWQNILSKHISFKEVPEDRWIQMISTMKKVEKTKHIQKLVLL